VVGVTITESIRCPKCGCEIPLTEAIEHQVAERLRDRLAAEIERQEAEYAKASEAKEAALRQEFAAAREELEEKLTEQVSARVATEVEDLRSQVTERDAALQQARAQELEFRKAKRKLDDERAALELEVARRLDDERKQLVGQATERLLQEHRLQLRERDQTMAQMKTQIEDLKRASELTQAGLRGEVMEREIEDLLREHFPDDLIVPVKSGARGADILQTVRSSRGQDCGAILWESKRAANWSNGWIAKLKDDQKAARADIAAIVTTVLPADVRYMDHRDGIWVVESVCVLAAAGALRAGLLDVAQARSVDATRSEALAVLHEYLCGKEFRGRFEPIIETIIEMKTDLETERRGVTRYWSKRDKEIERLGRSAAGMYGDLQGILGPALPTVSQFELPAG
jgi:hypothetical protein